MTIGGFSAYTTATGNSAAFGAMQGMEALSNLARGVDENSDPSALLKQEQSIRMQMLQDELEYKAMEAMEEGNDKQKDDWAESFDVFS